MGRAASLWWLACLWLGCCCRVVRCHPDSSRLSFAQSLSPSLGSVAAVSNSYEDEVCLDVDIRNSVSLFSKLENCSVVEGSVQILLIDNAEARDFENMSFPKLREITGYLLLYRVQGLQSLSRLFPNLAVIRGDTLFHNFALVVYELRAILDVGLVSLTTIQRGSVRIEKNPHLCYVDTVDWDVIAKAGRGGHFIKDNKLHAQCPNTCPDTDCPKSSNSNSHMQQKLCWNSQHCQKICSVDCVFRNLTCSDPNSCCHPECLGGCSGRLSKECVACRHVIYNGTCLNHCPSGTYKYLEHRCIEADKCRKVKNNLSIAQTQDIHWKPILQECLPYCPSGYAENERNKHECKPCRGQCPKVCKGAVIDSVSSAQKLKGCTLIEGSLEIQIQGGDNIIKELEANLNSIQEIRGYLKIARSFPLVSLNFLRDLTVIRGEQLDKKEYALLVLDNQNLQELWDWENRKTKLSIQGGKVFFHFNSKLCPNKIKELQTYADVMDWDDRDVSPSSNGDRVACNVIDLQLQVFGVTHNVAVLSWNNFRKTHSDMDFRSLLGYVVFYRETTHQNVTIFDGRDACGTDMWKVDDVDASDEETDKIFALLPYLKPFTMYAAYMRTYTIASAVVGAQSSIIYFTTSPTTSSAPVNVRAHANSPNEIVIAWNSPKEPNGLITHYQITGIKETDSSKFIGQRNYCNEPLIMSGLQKSRNNKISESEETVKTDEKKKYTSPESKNCCSCTKSSISPDHVEEAESQIAFEDFLHNTVYIKNPNAGKSIKNVTINIFNRAQSTTNPSNETETYTSTPVTLFTVEPTVNGTELTTTPAPDIGEGNFFYLVEDKMFLSVKNLHHFTEYTIEVRACQNNSGISEPCSSQSITTVRTLPLGGADDIDFNSIVINQENLTSGLFFVKWDPPKDKNGLIVNYHIEIKSAEANEYKALPACVTQMEYQKKVGYSLYDLQPGNYSLRLRATSLAGNGNWTAPVYFSIPDNQRGLKPELIALIIVLAIGISIFAFGTAFYFFYKKRFINEIPTMLYASVNPEYMSAVYEPDEWEVPREKITVLQELGQGSFGMVYRGEFETDEQRLLKCAVKTVNESASLRERIEFLQEASVMKAFNCHHVVKLLGVVSKGHPTLVVMELMGKGDLKAYLRSRRPDLEENIGNDIAAPTLREILQMAVEIADGMAYLAAKKFVHRDLAARNCMVSDDMTVKIGDFGMTRDIYETDYYRKGGKGLLPVRWMAPECLKDGLFSSQSDVWSYGVVIWEMATLASQPYQGLANEQVLHFVISGGRMSKPENCPEKLFAIMELCWAKNPKARPTFIELIDMLLPDINQNSFHEVSFYFTQRQELCAKEVAEEATASTPMRSQWADAPNSREESDGEVEFFPPTRNSFHVGDYDRNNRESFLEMDAEEEEEEVAAAAVAGPSGASVTLNDIHHSSNEDGAKGMSAATSSSDDSKGSKVSTTSNGSIPNGRIPFVPCRTTTC